LGAHYRCGCCILAGFLLFLLLAAVAVYLGCKYFYIRPVQQVIPLLLLRLLLLLLLPLEGSLWFVYIRLE
jgi:hypothetical protein